MLEDFPKEKLQEIYEILPEDLKQALFSQEITDTINDICAEKNLTEKQIARIIEYVGYVFLGLLPPNDFEKTVKEKLFLTDELSHRICRQILRNVFIPLKTSLELIHKTEIKLPPEITEKKEVIKEATKEVKPATEQPPKEEKPAAKKPKRDIYRESIN